MVEGKNTSRKAWALHEFISDALGLSSPENDYPDYVAWEIGNPRIRLDGQFTPEQLRFFASHMEEYNEK